VKKAANQYSRPWMCNWQTLNKEIYF